jgi:hypothetical protein
VLVLLPMRMRVWVRVLLLLLLGLVRMLALLLLPLLPCALLPLMGPAPVLALGLLLVLLRVLLLCLRVPGASLCVVCPLFARGGTLYAILASKTSWMIGVFCPPLPAPASRCSLLQDPAAHG